MHLVALSLLHQIPHDFNVSITIMKLNPQHRNSARGSYVSEPISASQAFSVPVVVAKQQLGQRGAGRGRIKPAQKICGNDAEYICHRELP